MLQFDPAVPGAPEVVGRARYEDRNLDGVSGAGDVLVLPFGTRVVLRGATPFDLDLPVDGDAFGAGAFLQQGPASNELTVVLGDGASLKTRQAHDPLQADLDPASGVDVQGALAPDVIENPVDGFDARASTPIDLVAGFVDAGQRLGSGATQAVALGDLEGDGDLDLIEGNVGRPSRAWFNDGAGSYASAATQELGTASTRAVVLVDVDGDGDLDLLRGNSAPEPDELWRNDGAGVLALEQLFGACDTRAFAAGDLDGDGDLDLVAADGVAPNVTWENREGLFFLREELADEDVCPGTDTIPPGCSSRDVALADLDRDGDLDLVEGNWEAFDLVRFGEDGSFGDPFVLGVERGATTSVALGDLDLDGDPDLVTGDGGGADRVWNNVGGSFADSGQRLGREPTSDVALWDVDHDGALDLLTAARGGGNRFWLNDRAGRFVSSGQALGTGLTTALALGDVERDGDVDLLAANEDGASTLWLQSLAGTWGGATLVPALPSPIDSGGSQGLTLADIELDGDVDLVLARGTAGSAVWRNDGAGAFTLAQFLSPAIDSHAIAAGDIDGDGDTDLIESRAGDTTTASPKPDRIWLNDGAGLFVLDDDVTLDNDHDARSVALVDVDGDGDLDYVLTDEPGSRTQCLDCGIRIFTNEGGAFTDSGQNLRGADSTPPGTSALALGDVDGNGLVDLVQAGAPFDAFGGQVWLNGIGPNPKGVFSPGALLDLSDSATMQGLALGDLDGDGDLDLVSTDLDGDESAGPNRVWFNDGGGAFVDSGQRLRLEGRYFVSVVLVDLERDGDLDVVAGESLNFNAVFENDGAGLFGPALVVESESDGTVLELATADVDRDGDMDVLAALQSGDPEVWFNR